MRIKTGYIRKGKFYSMKKNVKNDKIIEVYAPQVNLEVCNYQEKTMFLRGKEEG